MARRKKNNRINKFIKKLTPFFPVLFIILVILSVLTFSRIVATNSTSYKSSASETNYKRGPDTYWPYAKSVFGDQQIPQVEDSLLKKIIIRMLFGRYPLLGNSEPATGITITANPTPTVTPPVNPVCNKPEGCGGDCNPQQNNGCGWGGCRYWEQCADDNGDGLYSCHDRTNGQDYWKMTPPPSNVCAGRVNVPVPSTAPKTPTPTGAPPATPTPRPNTQGQPFVMILAHFYNSHKTYLRSGDILDTIASRDDENTPMTASNSKFQQAVNYLNTANTQGTGIRKGIIFSSYTDLNNLIDDIPADVEVIGYNMEGGMTPMSERSDSNMLSSVQEFARIAHAHNKYVIFAPIRAWLDGLENHDQLDDVVKTVDAIGYQAQNIPSTERQGKINEDYRLMKSYNQNVDIIVQLWIDRQTPQEMIREFNTMKTYVNGIRIGTINQDSQSLQVIQGLDWR